MKIRRLEKNIILLDNLLIQTKRTKTHGYIVNISNKYKNLINNLNISLKNKFLRKGITKIVKTKNLINVIDAVLNEIDNTEAELILKKIQFDIINLDQELQK